MEYHYYILKNGASTDKQKLKSGTFILRIPDYVTINFEEGEGPFKSVRGIKRNSTIYNLLKKSNSKRAQQIVEEKNIIKSAKLIAIPAGTEFKQEVVDGFNHSTIGRIKNGNLTGIHFYDPEKVKIIEIIKTDPQTGAFKAKFEYFDERTKKWILKTSPSSFFPPSWDLATLLMECKYALEQLDSNDLRDGKLQSITESKIKVELIIKNGNLKSIYPVI